MPNKVDGSYHDGPSREWREPSLSILFRKADPIGVAKTCCRRAMPSHIGERRAVGQVELPKDRSGWCWRRRSRWGDIRGIQIVVGRQGAKTQLKVTHGGRLAAL